MRNIITKESIETSMTVRELREFLETCEQDIQVVVINGGYPLTNCVRGICSVEQVKPYSCHDEPEYPNVVEIAVE